MTPIIRIAMRYLGMFLATKGFIGAQELSGDAELIGLVELAVGTAIAGTAELYYYLAKRFGWRT